MDNYYQRISQAYRNTAGDHTSLFQTLSSIADEIGWDSALTYLEQCVIEKRLAWLEKNLPTIEPRDNPLLDAYRLFYEIYLGVSMPEDGEVIEQTENKLVMRWWNHCPTLEVCQKFGLDTREICQKAYHQPVQRFMEKVHPNLRFERNYQALRPYTPYCEEIITLDDHS